MNKYRIKYERNDDARFISHLDLMRTMNRALKRSGAPLEYTKGFNPHTIMTVALPLSVGITSECEYLDITFSDRVDTASLRDKLNGVMPSGIKVLEIRSAEEERAFKYIDKAKYVVRFTSDAAPDCEGFLAMGEAVITKKSKSGEKEENILPDIFLLTSRESDGIQEIEMLLSAGSKRNLKPELVMSAIDKFQNIGAKDITIHRKNIYFDDGAEVF